MRIRECVWLVLVDGDGAASLLVIAYVGLIVVVYSLVMVRLQVQVSSASRDHVPFV